MKLSTNRAHRYRRKIHTQQNKVSKYFSKHLNLSAQSEGMQSCLLGRKEMGNCNITDGDPQHYLGFSASTYFLYPGSSGQPYSH